MKQQAKKPRKSTPGKSKTLPRAARKIRAKSVVARPSTVAKKTETVSSKLTAPAKRRVTARRERVPVPKLLLEGDAPLVDKISPAGPGERYALGPTPPLERWPASSELGELPESYGTERLFLTARDPHWLYASWDLTRERRLHYNALSLGGHLIVRTYLNAVAGEPLVETHVHPESRSWFIHVGRGGARYVAELGYRGHDGRWHTIATSAATITPPDRLSEDITFQFAKLPPEVKFEQVLEAVREVIPENVPLIEAVEQLRAEGHTALPEISVSTIPSSPPISSREILPKSASTTPAPRRSASKVPSLKLESPGTPTEWTPAQTEALAKVIAMDSLHRVWIGSLEITELIRRQLEQEISSMGAAELAGGVGLPGGGIVSISSPLAGPERQRGFWFNVNAELIIYGATEREARVAIGGRPIKLRPDGTFSFRFALPDGEYDLPVVATSPDTVEERSAHLSFRRATQYAGEVKAHPQDENLKIPSSAHVA